MAGPQRALGRRIALTLRVGTALAVLGIGAGLALALADGGEGAGAVPIVEMLQSGTADGLIGAGLLVLTLTPPVALAVAGWSLLRDGERSRAVTAFAAIGLLVATVVVAAVIGGSS